ncbi:MAG: hypothetical protein V8R81_03540 [Clostridia bacterium]
MENATDALHMAAAVLIFVLALSISINAFGEVRQTAQTIIQYKDREYDYSYVDQAGSTQRKVGIESIIPSIYKAYKENYKIIFETNEINTNTGNGIYQKSDGQGGTVEINYIDLEKETIGSDKDKEEFIRAILYGNEKGKNPNWATIQLKYSNYGIILKDEGIYDKINTKTFNENLGIYYQDETDGKTNTPQSNKVEKRVITYKN